MKAKQSCLALLLSMFGCSSAAPPPTPSGAPPTETLGPPSIEVPRSVRETLGITFVRAEHRAVSSTVRLPGRFVSLPEAVLTVRAPLSGRLTLAARALELVEAGTAIGTIASPELKRTQDELHKARHDVDEAKDLLSVAMARQSEVERSLQALRVRLRRLEEAGGRRAELEAELELQKSRLEVVTAERRGAKNKIEREEHHFGVQLSGLAERTGLSGPALRAPAVASNGEPAEVWETLSAITLTAPRSGRVATVHQGDGWVAADSELVTIIDEKGLWFEAFALEGDLGRLGRLPRGALVPARAPGQSDAPVAATVRFPPSAPTVTRRIRVIAEPEAPVPWARLGQSGFVEMTIADARHPDVAVPTSAIVRDGLEHLVFRRDPANPDLVVRVAVDLGESDGRWTAILNGIGIGDEVVLGGASTLKVATARSGARAKGHFHADGSFHAADEGQH